jgi:hypothetical protein
MASSGTLTSSRVQPIGFTQTLAQIARTGHLAASNAISQAFGFETPGCPVQSFPPPARAVRVGSCSYRDQLRAIRVRSSSRWRTGRQFPRPATGPQPVSSPSSDARALPKAANARRSPRYPRTRVTGHCAIELEYPRNWALCHRLSDIADLSHSCPGLRHTSSTSPTSPLGADPDPGPRLRHTGLRAPAHKLGSLAHATLACATEVATALRDTRRYARPSRYPLVTNWSRR